MTIDKSYLLGGEASVTSTGPDAFTFPLPNLNEEELKKHFKADVIFGDRFVTAPSIVSGGLGPLFNQNSCEGCHLRNGRGNIPAFEGDNSSSLLLRMSVPGTGTFGEAIKVPDFGGQLQTKAIFGVQPEGEISMQEVEEIVSFVNGVDKKIIRPVFTILNAYKPLPQDVLISPRIAPPVHGLGLLEAIQTQDILSNADEFDTNNDGISGKPNYVYDVLKNELSLGRFGWKAEQPTTQQQAADAAHNDMGLTNFYFTEENCKNQNNCNEGLQNELDLNREELELMTFYFQTLAVPIQRNHLDKEVKKGRIVFEKIGCEKCHIASFKTGNHDIKALSHQQIYPFTDLLLHDMGSGLSDGRPTFKANGNEWRTSPLWGIGLSKAINGNARFLHDGRARTIEEAILWHGGEGEKSKNQYTSMSQSERDQLLSFLKSL